MDAYIAAAIGFATAAVLAMVNSWLAGRETAAEGVRAQRIATYPTAWRRTGVVSRWPRTDAGRDHLLRLHVDLRRWYYGEGGMYLSAEARKRYEHLQLVLEAVLTRAPGERSYYEEVMEAASYFRTGLTRDLESRDRRGSIAVLLARREEAAAERRAEERLAALVGRGEAFAQRPVLRLADEERPVVARPRHAVDQERQGTVTPRDR